MSWIYGIDETCKCPVIGSLPVCIVKVKRGFFNKKSVRKLTIKDSKLTTLNQRLKTFSELHKEVKYVIRKIHPNQMNENLIDLEVKEIIEGLKELGYKDGEKVFIDLFDASKNNLTKRFQKFGFDTLFDNWVIEHKADEKYKVVSLASIFSKVYNDNEYIEIKKEYNIGSGSPADIKTIKFIIDNYDNLPWFVRRSWLTVKRLEDPIFRFTIRQRIKDMETKGKGKKYVGDLYKNDFKNNE